MIRIAIEVDEQAFLQPKSRDEVEREVLEAVNLYWLARRQVQPPSAPSVARSARGNLVDVLLSAPNVGKDSDFERVRDTKSTPHSS